MATVTFDTLKFVETLKEAGVPEPQAKAFSTAVQESHEAAELATKEDIAELRHEISDLRKDIDAKFEKLELRMTIKLSSIVVVALGAFTVIFKFL
jgi:DNA-binding transcriptional MerR regulator